MQRPRRTAEFCEDPQANKRLSRQRPRPTIAPSPAPGTAQKYGRQSRIAVPARPSSVDRGLNSLGAALIGGIPNSCQRSRSNSSSHAVGPTPQKATPNLSGASKSSFSRALFSIEKHRGAAASSVALQNDKRWVQDQVERITDFLSNEAFNGKISGIPPDFFSSRNGGLRQMSVKQFLAITNYFLQFVCGTRFKQITNVEDIVKILQQLHYPYQVNKSWLKTPNTQHSFGNVILLLDFFMIFVPPRNGTEGAQEQTQFSLQEPQECTSSQIDDENLRVPDIEFQANLIRDAENGFMLWDKQLDDEVGALQQRNCDELIQKRCGIPSLKALEADMIELDQRLKDLEQNRPQIRKQDEDECNQLEEALKNILQEIAITHEDLKSEGKKCKQLKQSLTSLNREMSGVENDIQSLNSVVSKQICNKEERDKLIEKVAQCKHTVQIQESSLRDLENENHHQQILQSRTLKQLKDEIHKFNNDLRAVEFSQINPSTSAHDLQLPLHAEPTDLERIKHIIKTLRESIETKIIDKTNVLKQFETENAAISQEIEYTLNPKIQSLKSAMGTAKKKMQKHKKEIASGRNLIHQQTSKLEELLQQANAEIHKLETSIAQKQQDLLKISEENEQTMKNTEEQYYKIAKVREERINRINADLQRANSNLLELTMVVDENKSAISKST